MLRKSTLRGYEIGGLAERLIATLYADDTTVYLSEEDDYEMLLGILETWCKASGARFNVMKTEIIPLGSAEYRATLIATRRPRADAPEVPVGIRIARDGEVTRILGSWPGNGTENTAAWSMILDKVRDALGRWARFRPSMNGKSIISRAIIGGCTQYLTAAQGMPPDVERKLDRLTLDFLWGGGQETPSQHGDAQIAARARRH
ncbi:hypothetical protein AURDEDRAFT_76637 [Auricularia subglabra TFB-10046 SS5]|uniref:Reverse transcriptase domain-containing protein n=1 Tax=Auricularia subglabra (strain TFB-10046 / SS5) TaxID=717982 RepID=J0CU41_AURST|nr:hypothetical protein AURDEDRAFT_76637 [Auricularia subglabra TFB-10046 SS5]